MNAYGFIALTAVMTLSLIALMVTLSSAWLGLSSLMHASYENSATRACMFAEGCAESALYLLAHELEPPASAVLSSSHVLCTLDQIIERDTGLYLMNVRGSSGAVTCALETEVDMRGERIIVTSWNTSFIQNTP